MQKIGKYNIIETIGKGAMGAVYKGQDSVIDRIVAIKVVHPHLIDGEQGDDLLARFQQEAKAAARCSHSNIVTLFDFGVNDETPFMVMEFIEGLDLRSLLKMGGAISTQQSVQIIDQVLDALQYAHDHGVVHRDIKPANIMVLDSGKVKVADFGVARLESSDLTNAGDMVGTPNYMSPEALRGAKVDNRSDLYAVGIVLLELLTGTRPAAGFVDSDTIFDLLEKSSLDRTHKSKFHDLLVKALDPKPNKRFQNAREFAREVTALLSGQPVSPEAEDDLGATVVSTRQVLAATKTTPQVSTPTQQTGITIEAGLLGVIEKSLATYLGPLSSVLIRKRSSQSVSFEALVSDLAARIPNEQDRQAFVMTVKSQWQNSLSGTGSYSTTAGSRVASGAGISLDPQRQEAITQALAFYLGPLAGKVVKKTARKAGSEEEFLRTLSEKIPDANQRREFIRKIT